MIVNPIVIILDKIGVQSRFNFIKSVIWFFLIAIVIMVTIFLLASTRRVEGNLDPNFELISKENINNQTVYNVSQKGYGGRIKAEVIFENDRIISIEITSHHETPNRYQLVIDEDYINKLISNQNDLESLDTVSSATVTSNALKKMIANVLEYEKSN